MKNVNLLSCYPSFARVYEIGVLGNFALNICVNTSNAEYDYITMFENAKLLKRKYPLYGLQGTIYYEINKLDYNRIITSNKCETISDVLHRVKEKQNNIKPQFEFNPQNTELLKQFYNNSKVSVQDFEEALRISEVIAQFDGTPTVELSHIAEACLYKSLASESYLRAEIDHKPDYTII